MTRICTDCEDKNRISLIAKTDEMFNYFITIS